MRIPAVGTEGRMERNVQQNVLPNAPGGLSQQEVLGMKKKITQCLKARRGGKRNQPEGVGKTFRGRVVRSHGIKTFPKWGLGQKTLQMLRGCNVTRANPKGDGLGWRMDLSGNEQSTEVGDVYES